MLANLLTAIVGLVHVYALILEMVLWERPAGLRTFGTSPEFAKSTRALAANQGLYNGFLAAGLFWSVWLGDAGDPVKLFFLVCVIIAGLFGAATVGIRILFVQAVPALLALLAVLLT